MEILSFIKIQNNLTREEFNNRFKIEFIGAKPNGESDFGLSDGTNVVSCPHIKCCGINGNCKKCWENAVLRAEFKNKDLLLGNIKNCKTTKELDILTMDVVNDKDNFEANQKAFIKKKNELKGGI